MRRDSILAALRAKMHGSNFSVISESRTITLTETASQARAKLVILRGGTQGKEFTLDGEIISIGRWDPDGGAFPEIDLTNDDIEAKISRKHSRILVKDGSYLLEDMGSLNGTYINRGPRLVPGEPQEIKDGDEVIMGKTFFRFEILSGEPD